VVGARLGNTGGNRADTDLGHEFDRHVGCRVDVLQVEDQLRQVLDGVDVVVRRRRDQADAGARVAQPRDQRVDLAAGQLAALAGLSSLKKRVVSTILILFGGAAILLKRKSLLLQKHLNHKAYNNLLNLCVWHVLPTYRF
jgi:hypothetical protein